MIFDSTENHYSVCVDNRLIEVFQQREFIIDTGVETDAAVTNNNLDPCVTFKSTV